MKIPKDTYGVPIPLEIDYNGLTYKGKGYPLLESCVDGVCFDLRIVLNDIDLGFIYRTREGWRMNDIKDKGLVDAIGEEIKLWYE